MILLVIAALCVISVPLTGGHLMRVAVLPLRGLWAAPTALALQVLITTTARGGNRTVHIAVHISSYVLIGLFLFANRRIPGVRTILAGALMNAAAIVANGGVMPATATAQRLAGLAGGGAGGRGFQNSAVLAHPVLRWLGDIIPVPGPLPNVLSIGDCIIFAGMLLVLHRACGGAVRLGDPRQRGVGGAIWRDADHPIAEPGGADPEGGVEAVEVDERQERGDLDKLRIAELLLDLGE